MAESAIPDRQCWSLVARYWSTVATLVPGDEIIGWQGWSVEAIGMVNAAWLVLLGGRTGPQRLL